MKKVVFVVFHTNIYSQISISHLQIKEDLLSDISSILEDSGPLQDPTDVQFYTDALTSIIKDEGKVNVNAQVALWPNTSLDMWSNVTYNGWWGSFLSQELAGSILDVLSECLTSIDLTPDNITALTDTAKLLVESCSHILGAFNKDKEVRFFQNIVWLNPQIFSFLELLV